MKKSVLSKFRRIGIIAGKPNRETATMIFLLQHLTPAICNGKKSQINILSSKELESSDLQRRLENSELITVKIFQNKTGRNFNSIADVLTVIPVENRTIAQVILASMEQTTPPGMERLFGQTIGDTLETWKEKEEKDILAYQKTFKNLLFPHLEKICDSIEEFRNNAVEKGILASKNALVFKTIRSEHKNFLMRTIATAEGVDILLHRRDTEGGNFISTSEKATPYLSNILDVLRKEEVKKNPISYGLWHKDFRVINTDLGKRTELGVNGVESVIENTVRDFILAPSRTGKEMPLEASHSDSLQTDTAMAKAPVIALHEREFSEVSASQVA